MAAEQAQRESEARFAAVFHSSPGTMSLISLARVCYVAVNDTFEQRSGYTREEAVGRSPYDVGLWVDRESLDQVFRALSEQGAIRGLETRFRLKSSELRVALVSATVVEYGGEPCALVLTENITERKRAEEALRQSEERFRSLVENVPGAVYRCEPHAPWRMVLASEGFLDLTGYPASDFLRDDDPRLWADLVLPEDLGALAIGPSPGPYEEEYRILHADGSVRWVHDRGRTIRDASGGLLWLDGVVTDATERRLAHEALRESEERYRVLFEQANDGIALADAETGILLDCNRALAAMVGRSSAELIGQHQSVLHAPEDPRGERHTLGFERTTASPDAPVHSARLASPDGRGRDAEVKGTLIQSGGRRLVVGVFRDVTERRRAEEERRALEARLLQAQHLESLGVLAGGIAHDFNNILGGIMGFAELTLQDCPEGSSTRQNLEQVLAGALRARDLVNQILAFSRQAGMEARPLQLRPLLREALRLVRASLPASIEIRREMDQAVAAVEADASQIHQVIMNLCANAAYAMREAGGVLTVALREVTLGDHDASRLGVRSPGLYVCVTVGDTGSGMDAATRKRIFEPFFTTKPAGEGTGLGLATCHGIVTSHGGAITVESEPGQGTRFHVYIPAAGGHVTGDEPPRVESEVPSGSGRVLFVDDEEPLVLVAQALFASLGYEAVTTTSPEDALAWLRADAWAYDVLVTDQTMPAMQGLELAAAARRIRPGLPVIVTSGFATRVDAETALAVGVGEVLAKPYSRRELAEAMQRALGGSA
jgi:PAS domain S-box-containing protein